MLNPQQIRKALIKYAEWKKRPPFEPIAVRKIIAEFEHHPLKEAILYFCEQDPHEQALRVHELTGLCRTNKIRDYAEQLTGFNIRALMNGDEIITNKTWWVLKSYWDDIESKCFEDAEVRKQRKRKLPLKLVQIDMWGRDEFNKTTGWV